MGREVIDLPLMKIEVLKNGRLFYYTGTISKYSETESLISTIRGEKLIFYNSQIQEKLILKRSDANEGQKNS